MKRIRGLIMPLLISIGFVIAALWNYYSKPLSPFLFACNTIGFVVFFLLIVVHTRRMLDSDRKS